MGKYDYILKQLPYQDPFLFVDELMEITEDAVVGIYTFKEDAFFYKGHFKGNPITPGVILTECMAQIGVVCLGIYLFEDEEASKPMVALTSSSVDFFKPVLPGEEVRVVSEKEYFRFGKLKCQVEMFNEKNELVCRGSISGMIGKYEK